MPVSPFLDFNPQFTWKQATWAAAVAAVGYLPNDPIGEVLQGSPYFCNSVNWVQAATVLQVNIAFVDTGKTVWIGIEGTTNVTQALAFVIRDQLVRPWGDDRAVYRVFWETAQSCLLSIKSQVTKTQPLAISGHSLGGAAAMLVADMLQREGYDVRGVITFGQPYTANADYFGQFVLPYDRVAHNIDVVTKVPQFDIALEHLYLPIIAGLELILDNQFRPFVHSGNHRELDLPGIEDEQEIILGELKNLGTRYVTGHITTHLMGNYLGLVYDRCSGVDQQLFLSLAQQLQTKNSFVKFNGPFPADDPEALALSFETIQAEERAFAATLISPESKVRLRLFKSPFTLPEIGEPFIPVEADFPGYGPITPTGTYPISGGGLTDCAVGPGWFTWTLSEHLETPVTIGGIFATYIFEEGGEKRVFFRPFPSPITLQQLGDVIKIEVTARVARFTD